MKIQEFEFIYKTCPVCNADIIKPLYTSTYNCKKTPSHFVYNIDKFYEKINSYHIITNTFAIYYMRYIKELRIIIKQKHTKNKDFRIKIDDENISPWLMDPKKLEPRLEKFMIVWQGNHRPCGGGGIAPP
jgi:hypothetical protein